MSEMISAWAGVLIVMGAAILVTLAGVVWIVFFRKGTRRRHRRRRPHGEHQQPNPTLAQIGGLPPARPAGKLSEPPPPTLTTQS
ncbi:MAG: hypothetical protein WBN22_15130 [Verrucomicrobiia bacterium]